MREIILFVASLAGAVILTALAVLLQPQSPWWKWFLWGGTAVFIACAAVLLVDFFRPGRPILVLVGIGFGTALAALCTTYALFTPVTQSGLPSLVLPGPHARVEVTAITPYTEGTGPVGLVISVKNSGDASSNPPTRVQVAFPSLGPISMKEFDDIVQNETIRAGGMFARDKKDVVSIQPGEEGNLSDPLIISREQWNEALEGKLIIYAIVVIAYTDGNLAPNAMWVHVYGVSFLKKDDQRTPMTGHEIIANRTFVRTIPTAGEVSLASMNFHLGDSKKLDLIIKTQR